MKWEMQKIHVLEIQNKIIQAIQIFVIIFNKVLQLILSYPHELQVWWCQLVSTWFVLSFEKVQLETEKFSYYISFDSWVFNGFELTLSTNLSVVWDLYTPTGALPRNWTFKYLFKLETKRSALLMKNKKLS